MKKRLLVIEDEMSVAKQLKWGLGKEYVEFREFPGQYIYFLTHIGN